MTDLVKIARQSSEWPQFVYDMADEIERLSTKMCGDLAACESKQARIEHLEAEIERLRAALSRINDWYAGHELADGELEKLLAAAEVSDE